METPSLKPLKQQHKFCRKSFNEHSYHVRFQFAKQFQRRRLKVYRQWMPSDSNTSHDLYILDQSCHTPSCLFLGGLYPSTEKLGPIFYTPVFSRGNGGCSLNLYTQLYVCKYQQLKHLYCSSLSDLRQVDGFLGILHQ